VFVSMAAPNAIAEANIDAATVRYVVPPALLNSPTGLAVATEDGADTLYVGDLFGGVRRVNGDNGALIDTPEIGLFQPAHVSIAGDHLIAVSQVFGTVQRLDRRTLAVLATWEGFSSPGDAVEEPDGDVVVADTGTGRVLRVSGPEPMDRSVVATGLDAPTGLARAADGTIYVTETGGGRVLRIAPGRATAAIATGLAQPEGIAVDAGGSIFVMEVGARRLMRIDPTGAAVIATDLPVGLSNGPSLYRGVAAGAGGIYFSSDIDNAIYKVTPVNP
jgi:sugar lactone lactonase YvrE